MRRMRPAALTTRPRISVVVPCYNYARFLPQAVGSALDQEHVDVDVLIVDDASTDDSVAVAEALAEADPRIDLLVHEENRGHIRTYNDGLAKVSGDYVALLSADDALTRNSLTRAAGLFETHREVGLVYGWVETFQTTPPAPGRPTATSWSVWSGEEWIRRVCSRGRNLIQNPEALMRRDLLDELGGGYDPEHPHAGDMLLWLRAARRAAVGRVNGTTQAGYRVHGSNMHSTTFDGLLTDARHIRKTFDAFFAESPDPTMQHRAMRGLAHEALVNATMQQVRGARAEELAAFAEECVPGITASARWAGYRRREARPPGPVERQALSVIDSWRWRLRTQRWRRWGT